MAFLDKIMFWKQHEEPVPERYSEEENLPPASWDAQKTHGANEEEPMGMDYTRPGLEKPLGQTVQFPQQQSGGGMNRDTELILAKLDAIKAKMESVDARLERLEEMAKE